MGMWVLVVGVVGVGGGRALSKREGARVWTGERTPTENHMSFLHVTHWNCDAPFMRITCPSYTLINRNQCLTCSSIGFLNVHVHWKLILCTLFIFDLASYTYVYISISGELSYLTSTCFKKKIIYICLFSKQVKSRTIFWFYY